MNTPQSASPTIYAISTFVDQRERVVECRREVVPGMLLPGPATYFAQVQGTINTPDGPMRVPLRIPLPARDEVDAFGVFDETCRVEAPKHLAIMVDEMKKMHQRMMLEQSGKMGLPPGRG